MTDKARRVNAVNYKLPGGDEIQGHCICHDDPSGAHALVPWEVWERVVDTDEISQHKVAEKFWEVWNEVGETHKHGFYESTWMAIRAALAEIASGSNPDDSLGECLTPGGGDD